MLLRQKHNAVDFRFVDGQPSKISRASQMCVIVVKELLFEVSRLQYTLWDGTAGLRGKRSRDLKNHDEIQFFDLALAADLLLPAERHHFLIPH